MSQDKPDAKPVDVDATKNPERELSDDDLQQVAGGTQLATDAQKQQMERWKIMQDTQTK